MRTRTSWLLASLTAALLSLSVAPASASESCGPKGQPCRVALGTYHIALPEPGPVGGAKPPVVIFFHGAGGLGEDAIAPGSFLRPFVKAGYAVIGADGMMRPGAQFGTGWSFRPEGDQQRDELAFAREVLTDATERFSLDRSRVLVSGFSIGASLVWYLACKDPELGAAYAPLAGGFWRPHPTTCAGPVDLLQTHGWADRTVPLEGRPLRAGIQQGDIFEGLQLWRAVNGCNGLRPDSVDISPLYWQRRWTGCQSGRHLVLALHAGDHDSVPSAWADMARGWFEDRLQARAQ